MSVSYLFPEFEVVRSETRCTACRICEKQCACGVHSFDEKTKRMRADESRCVDCQRCVSFCPTHALKIVKNDCTFRENANWQADTIREIYKQAASGGVLLSSMGTPKALPVYWDRILINASQVTNPPIDPLREPMETRVFLGKKPAQIARDENGRLKTALPPQLELSMPVLFSAMSYGSISYNAQKSLALAVQRLGTCWNAGEGGLHEDFYDFGPQTVVQVASGRFGVYEGYLNAGAAIEIKMGQGAKPGIGGHLPGRKVGADVSRTRMIPQGSDAISPTTSTPSRICGSWCSRSRRPRGMKSPSSSRWRRCTTSRPSPAVSPAAARTSSPSTACAAARARRRHASATTSVSRSSLRSRRLTSGCATRGSATG